jgi:two-component system cell cycle sensor histidine kinase/response regulator CckA
MRKRGEADSTERGETAEERQGESGKVAIAPLTFDEAARLVHELQVHKIELELQNEELLRSRNALERAVATYSELYDFAPVSYLTLGREGQICALNLTAARMLGEPRAALLARRFRTFVAVRDLPTFEAFVASAFDGRVAGSCEIGLVLAPNLEKPKLVVQLTFSAAKEEGQMRVVATDVTERRSAEEQVRAWQRMEAVGSLAGGVAHDFNNLMMIILGHAAFALENVDAGGPAHRDLVELSAAAERAAALTRQLLAFGGRRVVEPELVDVSSRVRDTASMLGRFLGGRIELVLNLAESLRPVEVDPVQLGQVVMNLAINASDAMPEGGTLTLSTAHVETRTRERRSSDGPGHPGPFVLLSVRDTGTGMTPATMDRIFEPFFTTKSSEGGCGGRGAGFGLSTVYGIVKQCGGEIAVESAPARGTTFEVYLPLSAARVLGDRGPPAVRARAPGGESILVVDDERALRNVTRRILESAGYSVSVAANGEEALRILGEHSGAFHLVLSDLVMPGMSGIVLAARVREAYPAIRIVHMSGHIDDEVEAHGGLGRAACVSKPFTAVEIKEKIRAALDAPAEITDG